MTCAIIIAFWQITATSSAAFVHNIEVLRDNMDRGQSVQITGVPRANAERLRFLINGVPDIAAYLEEGETGDSKLTLVKFK